MEASGPWYLAGPGTSMSVPTGERRSSTGRKQALGLGPPGGAPAAPACLLKELGLG